jgi:hypothetical protein
VELLRFVDDLRRQLLIASEAGGDDARGLAERLLAPLESSVRLVLLDALSAAADEITRELAPGSVDVRLRGLDPEFVVTPPPADQAADAPADRPAAGKAESALPSGTGGPAAGDGDEGTTARITLRLPEPVKLRVEQAAGRSGLSVNSWLVKAATNALGPQEVEHPPRSGAPSGGQRVTGWAR